MKRYKLTTAPSWEKPKTRLGRVETQPRLVGITSQKDVEGLERFKGYKRRYRPRYGHWVVHWDWLSQPKIWPWGPFWDMDWDWFPW